MKDDLFYLNHILDAIEKVEQYTKAGKSNFLKTTLIQDAVIRQFEIIGEATKKLSERTTDQFPDIPWSAISKFRDILIHHYFAVSADQVWSTVEQDLPNLKKAIEAALRPGQQ